MSRQWTPTDLDEALRALAASIETPHPDYARRVSARLTDRPVALRAGGGPVRRRAILIAAAVLLALGLIGVPATRHAIASWFSFSGVDIRRAPPTSPLPTPTRPAQLDAGVPVTLETARAETGNRLVLARGLPKPDQTFFLHQGDAVAITLAYRHVPGLGPTANTGFALVITEFFDAGRPLFTKILHTGATADVVTVHGNRGVFLDGPQEIITIDRADVTRAVLPRTSANTLIWSEGPTTYRIEADVDRAGALRLADLLAPH